MWSHQNQYNNKTEEHDEIFNIHLLQKAFFTYDKHGIFSLTFVSDT